jgi:hypothetical protein
MVSSAAARVWENENRKRGRCGGGRVLGRGGVMDNSGHSRAGEGLWSKLEDEPDKVAPPVSE